MAAGGDCRRGEATIARAQITPRGSRTVDTRAATRGFQRRCTWRRGSSPVTSDTPTIEEFGRKLRARDISAVEITDDCLKRIDADNGRLNAFILVMTDEARRQARDADRELAAGRDRGPLHGVPVSIKDLFDIRGTATSAASRVREGHIADRDAPAITHLRRAGAVLIGKTNLHEFAL